MKIRITTAFVFLMHLQRSLSDDPIHTALLYGNIDLGYYYVNIYAGTPPQKQSLIVDTASHITTFPCTLCTSCGRQHLDALYDLNKSTSFKALQCKTSKCEQECQDEQKRCTFGINYAEGSSLAGHYVNDYILFGDVLFNMYKNEKTREIAELEQVEGYFGCTTLETNLFFSQLANGIMGLSPKTGSGYALPNIVDSLYAKEKGSGQQNFFSLCLGHKNGYMAVGSYDTNRHQPGAEVMSVKYNSTKLDVYNILLKSIIVNGDPIISGDQGQEGQGTFIDSGSTYLVTYPELYQKLRRQFKCISSSKCPSITNDNDSCAHYDSKVFQSFEEFADSLPVYYFELETFTFEWRPADYLIRDLQALNNYCLPLYQIGGERRIILGQVWMKNWDVGFNKDRNEVTFVRSNCSSENVTHTYTDQEIKDLQRVNEGKRERRGNKHQISSNVVQNHKDALIDECILVVEIFFFLMGLTLGARWLANKTSIQQLKRLFQKHPYLELTKIGKNDQANSSDQGGHEIERPIDEEEKTYQEERKELEI